MQNRGTAGRDEIPGAVTGIGEEKLRDFYRTVKMIPSDQNSEQRASDKEVFYERLCNSQRIHGICGE